MTRKKTFRSENDVKAAVKEILDRRGWMHWPNSAGPYSVAGLSDRMALREGVFVAIECKYNGRVPTANQSRFLDAVASNGGYAIVVDEGGLADFEEWLAGLEVDERLADFDRHQATAQ